MYVGKVSDYLARLHSEIDPRIMDQKVTLPVSPVSTKMIHPCFKCTHFHISEKSFATCWVVDSFPERNSRPQKTISISENRNRPFFG